MKCEDFGRYIDNYESLTEQERKEMSSHAEVCGKCQAELDFFLSMIAATKSLPKIEPPSDFMSSLNARLDKEDKRVVSMSGLANHLRRYRIQYVAAAACLALVTVITTNRSALLDRMNNDGSGVISESTVATDTSGGQSAGEESTPPADENEAKETVTEIVPEGASAAGGTTAAPAAVQATPIAAPKASGGNSAPAKASGPAVSASNSSSAAETAVQTEAPVAPAEAAQSAQAEAASSNTASKPAVTEESTGSPKEDYGIALAGVINNGTETATVTYDLRAEDVKASLQASEIKANYSLADGGESIAYGRYYTLDRNGNPISNATGIGSIKIASEDADKAMDVLNRYPVDENGEVYTTDSVNLTRILSRLRSEGISYTDYTISGSGEVKFKVIFN